MLLIRRPIIQGIVVPRYLGRSTHDPKQDDTSFQSRLGPELHLPMVLDRDSCHELARRPLPYTSLSEYQSAGGLEGVPRTYRQSGEEETDISGQANAGKLYHTRRICPDN